MDEKKQEKNLLFRTPQNNQPVILSGENCEAICVVELLRVERKRTSKSKVRSTAGIWLKISVACRGECYIDTKATQTRCHIPSSHSLLGFTSLLAR